MRVFNCLSTMRLGARPVAKALSFIVDTRMRASQLKAWEESGGGEEWRFIGSLLVVGTSRCVCRNRHNGDD